MTNIDIAYPLHWPEGWPREKSKAMRSRFSTTFAAARQTLLDEISRLGGRYPTISTNVNLRRDGLPYANQPEPDDKGVAVYFELKGKPMCFAYDRWNKVGCNIQAVAKSIEAMRGLDRWGCSEILNRAFDGFKLLTSSENKKPWCQVLGLPIIHTREDVIKNYKQLVKKHHPDVGGDPNVFMEIQEAYKESGVGE